MFGNVPRALWSQWMSPDAHNRIELATRGLLVEDLLGKRVLFETGIGAFFSPSLRDRFGVDQAEHVLLSSLEARGTTHEDIDVVVLSHLHFDHAGGLLAGYQDGSEPTLLFPKARFLVGEHAWHRACDPHRRDRASFIPELPALLEASGRLELVNGERSKTLGDAARFRYTNGHTPGLMHTELGGDGGVLFCSDLMPARPWVHLPVTMGYDRYPEALIDEKTAALNDALKRDIRLFFVHDSDCAMARVAQDAKGRFTTIDDMPSVDGLVI